MDNASDYLDLVRRIASREIGAADAETELCHRFGPRALLYGRKHLRTADGARDLAQAAMLAVIVAARAGKIQDGEHLDRFVLGTCRNIATRMREQDARGEMSPSTALEVIATMYTASGVSTADHTTLYQCLKALDARGLSVVHLSFNEERSAGDVALALDTTVGNVRVLRHRAIAQLRTCMDKKHDKEAG